MLLKLLLELIVIVVFGALLSGFGLGLVFKSGFTTGGTDILNQILAKYGKMGLGKAMLLTDGIIILLSLEQLAIFPSLSCITSQTIFLCP